MKRELFFVLYVYRSHSLHAAMLRSFYCGIIFCCMDMPHFVLSPLKMDILISSDFSNCW